MEAHDEEVYERMSKQQSLEHRRSCKKKQSSQAVIEKAMAARVRNTDKPARVAVNERCSVQLPLFWVSREKTNSERLLVAPLIPSSDLMSRFAGLKSRSEDAKITEM